MRRQLHRQQLGLSLVELMVGIAVGMFVVAAAATLVTTQLTENRKLLLEVQVQQDLRATADIITRELRRSGSMPTIAESAAYIWTPPPPGLPAQPWLINVASAVSPASAPSDTVTFSSNRSTDGNGPYGFRLSNRSIQSLLGTAAGWQPLTDRATMEVLSFVVRPLPEPPITVSCNKLCADGTRACWPTITVRAFTIEITGQSASDPLVVRSVRSTVRLKNDLVQVDPALGGSTCPV